MESGSVADLFGAVGTIAAVLVSLVLAAKKNKKILKVQYTVALDQHKKDNFTISNGKLIYGVNIFNYSQRPVNIYWCGMRVSDKRSYVRRFLLFLENRKSKIFYKFYIKLMNMEEPIFVQSLDIFGEGPDIQRLNYGESSNVKTISEEYVNRVCSSQKGKELVVEFCYKDTDNILYTAPVYYSNKSPKNKGKVIFL